MTKCFILQSFVVFLLYLMEQFEQTLRFHKTCMINILTWDSLLFSLSSREREKVRVREGQCKLNNVAHGPLIACSLSIRKAVLTAYCSSNLSVIFSLSQAEDQKGILNCPQYISTVLLTSYTEIMSVFFLRPDLYVICLFYKSHLHYLHFFIL